LVYTTSWRSKEIGVAHSKDLVHWSEEELVPVMHYEPETLHSWAPEVVYDQENKHYLIYWSSFVTGSYLFKIVILR
jgi:beta-xylosidase